MTMATKLRLLLAWVRFKKWAIPVLAALVGALVALKMRKPAVPAASPFSADRARTDKILADAVRPHIAARVEAAKAAAATNVAAAKDAHAKALADSAKVHTASPSELDAMLKAYAKKARDVAKLLVLGWALSAGTAHAQEPEWCDAERCVLPIDVARALMADAVALPAVRLEAGRLSLANAELSVALNAQTDATAIEHAALESVSLALTDAQRSEAAMSAKLHAWYRRPLFLLLTGLVVGAGGALAVAL